jgi:hypothetical protein
VSVLCPQGVDTDMLRSLPVNPASADGFLSPDEVATAVVEGLDRESFLILPHPQVARYVSHKASDYDRWLAGMRRLREKTK